MEKHLNNSKTILALHHSTVDPEEGEVLLLYLAIAAKVMSLLGQLFGQPRTGRPILVG